VSLATRRIFRVVFLLLFFLLLLLFFPKKTTGYQAGSENKQEKITYFSEPPRGVFNLPRTF
jgi:regulatory protein YycI of two-component signal transduction system YycFG